MYEFIEEVMKLKKYAILFIIVASISLNVMAMDIFTSCQPISSKEYQQMLGVGIDVNWAIFPKIMVEYKNAHDDGYNIPLLFKQRGFSHVRIRVRDVNLDSVQKDGLTLMQQLVMILNDCLKAKIIPIISYAANRFRYNPSQESMKEALGFWKEISKQFKNYPYVLSYDLIIETSGNISKHDNLLNDFYRQALNEIRNADKSRIIFISPNDTSNPHSLPKMWYPKDDKYTMIEWHFYASRPSLKAKDKLWTVGTIQEKNLILNKIKFAKQWCQTHGFYSWNGAWMPTNFNHAKHPFKMPDGAPMGDYPLKEEIHFSEFVSSSLKNAHIPFAINAGVKFFDYKKLKWYSSVSPVLDAVLK